MLKGKTQTRRKKRHRTVKRKMWVPIVKKEKIKGLWPLRKIISVYVRAKKNKRDFYFFFFSRDAYTRIIVIDLIIVKLFGVCLMIFPFKKKGFSM